MAAFPSQFSQSSSLPSCFRSHTNLNSPVFASIHPYTSSSLATTGIMPIVSSASSVSNYSIASNLSLSSSPSSPGNAFSRPVLGPIRPPPQTTAHVPCKFFKQGACQAGNSCPFSHSMNPVPLCKYYQKGNCKFGMKCANQHVLPNGRVSNYAALMPFPICSLQVNLSNRSTGSTSCSALTQNSLVTSRNTHLHPRAANPPLPSPPLLRANDMPLPFPSSVVSNSQCTASNFHYTSSNNTDTTIDDTLKSQSSIFTTSQQQTDVRSPSSSTLGSMLLGDSTTSVTSLNGISPVTRLVSADTGFRTCVQGSNQVLPVSISWHTDNELRKIQVSNGNHTTNSILSNTYGNSSQIGSSEFAKSSSEITMPSSSLLSQEKFSLCSRHQFQTEEDFIKSHESIPNPLSGKFYGPLNTKFEDTSLRCSLPKSSVNFENTGTSAIRTFLSQDDISTMKNIAEEFDGLSMTDKNRQKPHSDFSHAQSGRRDIDISMQSGSYITSGNSELHSFHRDYEIARLTSGDKTGVFCSSTTGTSGGYHTGNSTSAIVGSPSRFSQFFSQSKKSGVVKNNVYEPFYASFFRNDNLTGLSILSFHLKENHVNKFDNHDKVTGNSITETDKGIQRGEWQNSTSKLSLKEIKNEDLGESLNE